MHRLWYVVCHLNYWFVAVCVMSVSWQHNRGLSSNLFWLNECTEYSTPRGGRIGNVQKNIAEHLSEITACIGCSSF